MGPLLQQTLEWGFSPDDSQYLHAYSPAIVLTGGTAGAGIDSGSAYLESSHPPGISLLDNVTHSIGLFSEDIKPEHWIELAEHIRGLKAKSVIVVHGTDTMAWTAAALSFLLGDLPICVVMTGASLPPDHPDSDWLENLSLAREATGGMPPGVWVAFRNHIHRGTRVHKQSSKEVFQSVGIAPAVIMQNGSLVLEDVDSLPRLNRKPVAKLAQSFCSIRLHPGIELDHLLDSQSLQVLAVELYPSGTASESVVETMITLKRSGVLVAACTSAPMPDCTYPSTEALLDEGIPILQDMPLHSLTVKAMWAAEQTLSLSQASAMLKSNLVGELVA